MWLLKVYRFFHFPECCSTCRLPNGHISVAAFDRLAAIVGAFTRHMADVNANLTEVQEYEEIYRYMQTCTLLNDAGE